jgi:hypothetical protein
MSQLCVGWSGSERPCSRPAEFEVLGITFASLKDNLDLATPSGRLMFQIIGAMGEFERSLIQERVKAGLQNAKAKGRMLGRPSPGFSLRSSVLTRGAGRAGPYRLRKKASKLSFRSRPAGEESRPECFHDNARFLVASGSSEWQAKRVFPQPVKRRPSGSGKKSGLGSPWTRKKQPARAG